MDFQITSPAFHNHAPMPAKYTADGADISPPLHWDFAPDATKSFALIVDDPDAPGKVWVHWVVYNIPSTVHAFEENRLPNGVKQGTTDFGNTNYGGPSPPKGTGTHRYFFKLYALDTTIDLPKGITKKELEQALESHILAETQLVGTYSRDR